MPAPALTEAEELELLALLEQEDRERVAPKFEEWRKPYRYKIAYGGRGAGAKSWSAVSLCVQDAEELFLKTACLREIQESLEESVYSLIRTTVDRLGYSGWEFKKDRIVNTKNGSYFIFRGLKDLRAARSIKSLDGFDRFLVEEAAPVTRESWRALLPTLRKGGSELWALFNREEEIDPVYELFVVNRRANSCILELEPGPADNPWWYETTLPEEMAEDYKFDPDEAEHIWGGQPRKQGHRSILARARVRGAMDRQLDTEGQRSVGCDPADYGDDRTQIYVRTGAKVTASKTLTIMNGQEIAHEIGRMIDHDPAVPIRLDTTGIGVSCRDELQRMGLKVLAINFAQKAQDSDQFADVATEMYSTLLIDEIDIPDDPELIRELSGRQYEYDTKNRVKLEAKDKFKKRHGKSPDKGDALVLCFYTGGAVALSVEQRDEMRARRARGR